MPLWLAAHPLVLASKSAARRALLEAAGIPIEIEPADIDERAIEARAGLNDAEAAAALLAREKARGGGGQASRTAWCSAPIRRLALGERRFSKAADRAGAREQIAALARQDPYAAFGGRGGARPAPSFSSMSMRRI